jgi:D-alanyl-D-alanine carboxypeptidase/D-alanyl-D-alanine-endopeptidase (penicillin-binding protein 4)
LFEHQSKPLALIIRDLMRSSNNFTAEQIARTMGAEKYGAPGSQEKASDAIIAWLKETELYQPGVVAEDASGLSHTNQISADVLVGILQYMWSRPETGPEFVDALAIGGKDGTLKHRFKRTPLQGRIRAKSGTLWGVITLAGYGYDANNKPYAFAIMFNNFSPKASGRQIQYIAERTLNTLLR